MKYFRKGLLLVFLFALPYHLVGQVSQQDQSSIRSAREATNMISCEDYSSIKYNGYTVGELDATKGDSSNIKRLWGDYTSVEVDKIIGEYDYFYGENRFTFYDSTLTSLSIEKSNWAITVLGKKINVGDTLSELKKKFGKDLKVQYRYGYDISFSCEKIDSESLSIELNPDTNKVVAITYVVFT